MEKTGKWKNDGVSHLYLVNAENPCTKYDIKQTINENKEKHQLVDYLLIQFQSLQTNIIWIVWQTVRRITNEILGVKVLNKLIFRFGWIVFIFFPF